MEVLIRGSIALPKNDIAPHHAMNTSGWHGANLHDGFSRVDFSHIVELVERSSMRTNVASPS